MSRPTQRPASVFRSARRVSSDRSDDRYEDTRSFGGSSGGYPRGRFGRSDVSSDAGNCYYSGNSNNNNSSMKMGSRKDENIPGWESRNRAGRYGTANNGTCGGEPTTRLKNITFVNSSVYQGNANIELHNHQTNKSSEFDNYKRSKENQHNGRIFGQGMQFTNKSAEFKRPAVDDIARSNDCAITFNNTRSDFGAKTSLVDENHDIKTPASEPQASSTKPGGDSSNNNRVIAPNKVGDVCIVDNLIIETSHVETKPFAEVNTKISTPETTPTATQAASVAPQPSRSAVVDNKNRQLTPATYPAVDSQDAAFNDPRQSQVFQMLTGVQKLRQDTTFSDITVKVNDTEFRCHSFVLAINSPYFLERIVEYKTDKETHENQSIENASENGSLKKENKDKDEDTTHDRTYDIEDITETDQELSPSNETSNDPTNEESRETSNEASNEASNEPLNEPPSEQPNEPTTEKNFEARKAIELAGVNADIFSKILDFMYCQFEGVLTNDNCLDILVAANLLQLPHLRRTCATFVSDNLSAGNVFQVLAMWDAGHAALFEPRVTKRAHQVIRENFAKLSSAEEFLRISRHVMIPLMADNMLHIRSEMEVFQALLRWVRARPDERCSDMTLMLQHIRFPLMSSRELEKLREVPILQQNSLAMALIDESRAYGNLDYNERMAWPRHNSISRCLFSTRDLIMWTADRDKGLHFYSVIDGQHHKVTSFGELTEPASQTGHPGAGNGGTFSFDCTSSVCCYGDKIFFTGGEFNTDMVWGVDTGTGEVKVHAKMPRGRKFHSMVASKGCVYCLGGQDKRGYTVLEDVDAYIINKDMWVKVGHLAVPAYNMSAAVSGGAIYLVGGLDYTGQPLRIIQCFISLRSGLYSAFKVEVNNMPPSLLSARAVSCGLDKSIYIVCGHGEVYQFDPDSQNISHLTTLRNLSENPRVRFGLAYMGGCLVVIGGHQLGQALHEPIKSVCLDIASKTEVRDYSPMLPGDIVNTCLAAKLSSNILRLFRE